jgi:hypothetical protein
MQQQQQQQQQAQTNPAATTTPSSSTASSTAGRDLQTVHNSAMQQHTQPQQRNTVYQQAGYTAQGADRQMQSVCIYIDQFCSKLVTFRIQVFCDVILCLFLELQRTLAC